MKGLIFLLAIVFSLSSLCFGQGIPSIEQFYPQIPSTGHETVPTSPVPGVPETGDEMEKLRLAQALSIDEAEEIEIGRAMAASLLARFGMYSDERLTIYINLVGKAVAEVSDRPNMDYHFAILNTPMVNAFSCPGGYIFITLGALREMRNEAELAGVLSHEIAHVTQRHIIRAIQNSNILAFALKQHSEQSPLKDRAVFDRVVSFAVDILFKGLGKEDEYDADRIAVTYAIAVGYNPDGLRDFLIRLKQVKGNNSKALAVLSRTHPRIDDRVSRIDAEVKESNADMAAMQSLQKRFLGYAGILK